MAERMPLRGTETPKSCDDGCDGHKCSNGIFTCRESPQNGPEDYRFTAALRSMAVASGCGEYQIINTDDFDEACREMDDRYTAALIGDARLVSALMDNLKREGGTFKSMANEFEVLRASRDHWRSRARLYERDVLKLSKANDDLVDLIRDAADEYVLMVDEAIAWRRRYAKKARETDVVDMPSMLRGVAESLNKIADDMDAEGDA